MRVKELYDKLGEMMKKRPSIANMDVEIYNPYDEDPIAWNGTHNTCTLKNIQVEGFFDGETWDESTSSYEYLELIVHP